MEVTESTIQTTAATVAQQGANGAPKARIPVKKAIFSVRS